MINWGAVEKWRDELRSGKYTQTKYTLRDLNGGYCCLGVYCEFVTGITPIFNMTDQKYVFDNQAGVLPKRVISHLGCEGAIPFLFGEFASMLNDEGLKGSTSSLTRRPFNFDEIADLLDLAILEHEAGVPDEALIR